MLAVLTSEVKKTVVCIRMVFFIFSILLNCSYINIDKCNMFRHKKPLYMNQVIGETEELLPDDMEELPVD